MFRPSSLLPRPSSLVLRHSNLPPGSSVLTPNFDSVIQFSLTGELLQDLWKPNPDKPELNIDPPKAERFMDVARAAQALAPHVAPSFF